MEKLLMNVNEVTRKLGVNAYGLAKLIGEEGLPAIRLNGELKFRASEFNDWLRKSAR